MTVDPSTDVQQIVESACCPSADTDCGQIAGLYNLLARAGPLLVIALNRAMAAAMRDRPAAGLALIDEILARGELEAYHLAHSARAERCRWAIQIVSKIPAARVGCVEMRPIREWAPD